MRTLSVIVVLCLLGGRITAQVDSLEDRLNAMTIEQKVAQLFVATFYGHPLNVPMRDFLRQWQVGAVVLLPSNLGTPQEIARLTNTLQETVIAQGGVPLFIGVDQEGGLIAHLKDGFTEFPVPQLLSASQDPELAFRVGVAIGSEMRTVGLNFNLAPVADLNTNRRNPIIGRRSFGSEPDEVAPMVAGMIRGLQSVGVLATAKHFPGHGDTSEDSHVTLPALPYSLAELSQRELVPFSASIQAGVGAVMVAHIWFSAIDTASPLPASLSSNVILGILRETMGYNGIVITDAMDMDAIDTVYSHSEMAIKAIEAGNDLILLGAHVSPETQSKTLQSLVDAVHAGRLSEARIDASVRRILSAKARFGVLDWQPLEIESARNRLEQLNHTGLVQELFAKGISLVYDEKGLLPLSGEVLFVYPATRPSLWQTCSAQSNTIEGVTLRGLGVSAVPTDEDIAWVKSSAQTAQKIVVFTLNAETTPQQRALVQGLPAEKTLVVALQSPYDIETFPAVGAYMVTYSPLLAGNSPLCQILLGEFAPQGLISVGLSR